MAKDQEETDNEQRDSGEELDYSPPSETTKRRIELALRGLENLLRLEYERKLAAVKADAKTVEALNSDLDKRKEKSTRIDPVKAVIDKVVTRETLH